MNRVRRYDMVELLHPAQELGNGVLLLEGIVAKPGVLEYRQPDGTTIRELIPKEELMRVDSLATLGLKPFTNEHPAIPVDIDNMAEFRKGNVLQEIDSMNGFVKVRIMIDDPVTKDEIKRDGLRGLSPGYTTRIDKTSGVHPEFGPYDQIQRDRVYNHVAGTRKPRAGFAAHIRLDSGDAVVVVRSDQEGHVHALPGGKDFLSPMEDTPDHKHLLPQGNGTTGSPIATESGGHTHEIPGRFGGGETGIDQAETPVPTEDAMGVRILPKVNLDGLVLDMPDVATARAVNQYRKDSEARIAALEVRFDAESEILGLVDALEMTTDAEARADIFGRLKGALKALFFGRPGKRRRKKRSRSVGAFEKIGPGRFGLFDSMNEDGLVESLDALVKDGDEEAQKHLDALSMTIDDESRADIFGAIKRFLRRRGFGKPFPATRSRTKFRLPSDPKLRRLFGRDSDDSRQDAWLEAFNFDSFSETRLDALLEGAEEQDLLDALDAFVGDGDEKAIEIKDSLEMTTDTEARADIFGALRRFLKKGLRAFGGSRAFGTRSPQFKFGQKHLAPSATRGGAALRKLFFKLRGKKDPKRRGRRNSGDSRQDAWLLEFNQAQSSANEPRVDAQTTYKKRLVNTHRRPVE